MLSKFEYFTVNYQIQRAKKAVESGTPPGQSAPMMDSIVRMPTLARMGGFRNNRGTNDCKVSV
jgi:hypothetical protein